MEPIFRQCDVVVGNLECTLPGTGETVPTEPRVVSTPELVRSIKAAGVTVVSLANNHTFDCLLDGFRNLRSLLDEMGVAHFGAGETADEAEAPALIQAAGLRLAFLGAADERSGPSRFAEANRWGIVRFDPERMADRVRRLRRQVDHVIVSLHWGEERLLIPSPAQVEQARLVAEAGASLILGHHPHVLQGLEVHRGVPIIYSLGNFVACPVPFSNGDLMPWNRTERTGCILRANLAAGAVLGVEQSPTCDDGRTVAPDTGGFGARRIARANQALARGVTPGRYRREYFRVKTLLPLLAHLKWSELKRLRPAGIKRFLGSAAGPRESVPRPPDR